MRSAIIFDCEYLAIEGSNTRFWSGATDPDPVVVQIGAVRLGLDADFPILDTLNLHVLPFDRYGRSLPVDPYLTRLTGIDDAMLADLAVSLAQALDHLVHFADGKKLWSWGKDEFLMLALSCYVQNFAPPLPATRFGNLRALALKAGIPEVDIHGISSSGLASYFDLALPDLQAHDGLDDALSLAHAFQHLLGRKALEPSDLIGE